MIDHSYYTFNPQGRPSTLSYHSEPRWEPNAEGVIVTRSGEDGNSYSTAPTIQKPRLGLVVSSRGTKPKNERLSLRGRLTYC